MSDTRERILTAALRLFAENGYEAVSVSDIAGELGITKGALYRHYKSKRDIFENILRRMEQTDGEKAEEHGVPEGTVDEMEEDYRRTTVDSIVDFAQSMFRYWTEDSFAADFRRMLTLEQYRSGEMMKLYQQYLCSGPLGYMTDLFDALGLPNPKAEAVNFYAPMFLLYGVYDGAEDKEAITSAAIEMSEEKRLYLKEKVRKSHER